MTGPLAVLWEDAHGLAVSKPAGVPTQGPPGVGPTLESMVRAHLRPEDPSSVYLGTVHRLDRPVSGVILWAKTPKAARRWADQFAGRSARKEYWAIVEGDAARSIEGGAWDDWLAPPDAQGRARVVEAETPGASRAFTRVEAFEGPSAVDGVARLRLRPETGRTHQLRAQASDRGLPIVGDSTYGAARVFPGGIALHSRSLAVEHPATRRPLLIEAPLPSAWGPWWP